MSERLRGGILMDFRDLPWWTSWVAGIMIGGGFIFGLWLGTGKII